MLTNSKSFELNRPRTYGGSSFYVGWMRGMLVWDNSPSSDKATYGLPLVSYRSAQVASFG